MSVSHSPSPEPMHSPGLDDVGDHEATAVTEFVDAARRLLQDLREEKQHRRAQRQEEFPVNDAQCAVRHTAWFQDSANDVLRRVRVIQNLSQSVMDWNMCAEERMRQEEAKEQAQHLEDQVVDLVNLRRIELEAAWAQERSQMAAELASVKEALLEQTLAAESESASRSPRHHRISADPSPSPEKPKVDHRGRARALGSLGGRAALERLRPFVASWKSKMTREEMMSPRSYAQKLGVLVNRGSQGEGRNRTRSEASAGELSAMIGKCGNTITSRWVARFVTLDSRSMKIFVDQTRAQTKTNIPLHHVAAVKEHDKRAFAIKIKLHDGRSFFLGLQSEGMRKQWLSTINLYLSMPPEPSPRHPPSPRHMV
eukprot:TRINITY_DN50672_c0_g1_i2.p1 TRINITY_DN50672_c0_g1~~TRINITY_DN50672_c0_g1_i2.p1  ORF type:complete len:369 (+),score=73.01 TRINITY_DN50672_c0_g1_i2:155-1261(+)